MKSNLFDYVISSHFQSHFRFVLCLVLKSDDCKMSTADDGLVYGPVWMSKGERFRPTGAYAYLELRLKELQQQLKNLKKDHRELTITLKDKSKKKTANTSETDDDDDVVHQLSSSETADKDEISKVKDKSLLSMTKKELQAMETVRENDFFLFLFD